MTSCTRCESEQACGSHGPQVDTVEHDGIQALIRYTRGHIFIADRAQLLTQTCACYFQDQTIYSQTM